MLKYAPSPSALARQGMARTPSTVERGRGKIVAAQRSWTRLIILSTVSVMTTFVGHNIAKAQSLPLREAAAPRAAAHPVETLYAGLRKLEASSALSAAQRVSIMAPVIESAFDLPSILRKSVGLRFNSLSVQEQQNLLDSFRRFTVARYVSSFGKGEKTSFNLKPQKAASSYGQGNIIHSTISGADSKTEIDYLVERLPNGYRITDVLLNGHISQVAAQRADFSSGLASGGAEGLKKLLDRKTESFLQN